MENEPAPTAEPEQPPRLETSLSLGNVANIWIDGRTLTGQDDPDLLRLALTGNPAIADYFSQALEHFRSFRHHQDVQIAPPPLVVAILSESVGRSDEKVITREGYWAGNGIYTKGEDIMPTFLPFWQAVIDSGYTPEVRVMGGRGGRRAYLFIQPPPDAEAER